MGATAFQRTGVVFLRALETERAHEACLELASVLHVLEGTPDAAARVWVVTRNAQSASAEARVNPSQALLWGLGRTASLESPQHWGGLIDLIRRGSIQANIIMVPGRAMTFGTVYWYFGWFVLIPMRE